MTAPTSRLQRSYRRLLHCYPRSWRRHHEDEMVGVLLDQAEATGRSTVPVATALDLVGHGLEERLEVGLRWLPLRVREQTALVALVAGAGLSLVLLVGEMIGAHYRMPPESVEHYGASFISGPFLTIGVGLYLAFMTAALLVVRGHGGPARLLLLAAVGYAWWMHREFFAGGYPAPRVMVLVLFAGLGLLAALATLRLDRRARRRTLSWGAGFVGAVLVGLLISRPVLEGSVGTMATSGNVAFAALAVVLPVVGGASVLTAALLTRRHPGWPSAIAIAAFPVVFFCTLVSQSVNRAQADGRALFPLYYLLVVVAVALVHRRGRRQERFSAT